MLPPAATITGARIRELTGDDTIPDTPQYLAAFQAVLGIERSTLAFALERNRVQRDRYCCDRPSDLWKRPVPRSTLSRLTSGHCMGHRTADLPVSRGRYCCSPSGSDVYDAGTAEKY